MQIIMIALPAIGYICLAIAYTVKLISILLPMV